MAQPVDLPPNPAPATASLKGLQSARQEMRASIGVENNWGWSPAFDLLEHVPRAVLAGEPDDVPVNVMLDSAGDPRHILCTLSRAHRHTARPVHFYAWEPSLHAHARTVFFLEWLFEQARLDQLEDLAAQFLELYGNTLIRDAAAAELRRTAKRAAGLVRGGRGRLEGHIDCETFMKAKEADWIAEQMDHWAAQGSSFNIDVQWNNRIRADIGDRYDAKENVMDWDFNMGITPHTAHIRWPEYKDWRTTGVAFDWARVNPRKGHKYEYTQPNKTLALFDRKGTGYYQGDVRCGPYYAVGIDTPHEQLQGRQHDGSFRWSSGLIALHNVRAWLYELITGEPWEWSEFKLAWDVPDYVQKQRREEPPAERRLPNFKLWCCGIDLPRTHLLLNTKLQAPVRMHALYVGCPGAQNVTPERLGIMRPDGYVVVECAKFVVYLDDAQKDAYLAKVRELAAQGGWRPAVAVQQRLHRFQPPFKLPFARKDQKEEPKYTDGQMRDKARHESPWALAFVRGASDGEAAAAAPAATNGHGPAPAAASSHADPCAALPAEPEAVD
eukprot:TRINITY_DN12179_c0_g1_i1.p1 TRINITY_DN12179_c0_g1~~TRINITY_DN12179_c0_g1_i1.p1  ORF type:complete len:581 (+),score=180.26 TRINITY_DN12179_c0_g1_i1:83-1744(+)